MPSAARDGGIRVWGLATGELLTLLRVDGAIYGLAWIPDVKQFVAVGVRGIYVLEFVLPPSRHKG